jgi:hypothetical protein
VFLVAALSILPSAVSPTGASASAQPVPADLRPPLGDAAQDAPVIYSDGCHLDVRSVTPPARCVFGDRHGRITVALFGDSKAAQWFSALDLLGRQRGWRVLSFTKSACTAASVTVWSGALGRPYRECDMWRRAVFARIAAAHPSLVMVADDRLYELAISGRMVALAQRPDVWNAGLRATLTKLAASASSVLLVGDTPRSRYNVPVCLEAHLRNVAACATPRAQAIDPARLSADAAVAGSSHVRFLDPTRWVCPGDPCPPIIGRLLVYREQDHLTAAFVDALAPRLASVLRLS